MWRGKVMVTFKRLLLWFTFGVGLLTYPLIAGRIDSKERMIFIGIILLLGIFLTGTGRGRKVKRIRRRPTVDEDDEQDSNRTKNHQRRVTKQKRCKSKAEQRCFEINGFTNPIFCQSKC